MRARAMIQAPATDAEVVASAASTFARLALHLTHVIQCCLGTPGIRQMTDQLGNQGGTAFAVVLVTRQGLA